YSGIRGIHLPKEKNNASLQAWMTGTTGVPVLDAAIVQLLTDGWIPDILRRLLAVYFLKVVQADWRLGAYFFEYWMVDYDPCTNWVAWQNLAGLGPDPREERIIHFNEMGHRLDPSGAYVAKWLKHNKREYPNPA